MSSLSERNKDPYDIAAAVGLPDRVGNYASMILERLQNEDYQVPPDARTYPAVVYVAARDEREPVTAGEIAAAAGVGETAVAREFRRIVEILDITPRPETDDDLRNLIESFVHRFGDDLGATGETVETARDLYREGRKQGLFRNRAPAVAASLALYAASCLTDDDLTQADFEAVGVSESSIRKAYRPVVGLRAEVER
jgi:transcription initiation factor TFIIIB Brf1 subunit/transcription initiation factor TFIIB